uniref:Protein BCCIP homolog n=1 Tax=Scapholeberis mucronata TaxID=202097 RepID=A0A4Y7NLZ3_9CRUS|nr:EOG090X0C3Y [Scapholeberis mucronata]SVE93843.1 EOG090X0C3Y [Scapholeberis mucronata]
MSNPKRPIEDESSESPEEEGEESVDEEMGEEEELGENDREIQVEFAGQTPCADDFHGIKSLLHQLFLKAHINLSSLTELIIEQNYIGSILQQCVDDDNQDSDEEDSPDEEVFGITTVINLTYHKDLECIKELRKFLIEKTHKKLESLLNDTSNHVGLLLNERFINIPPQVAVPLLENLSKEIDEAKKAGKPFNFTHFILISKLHESTRKDSEAKKKKSKGAHNTLWVNAEEEPISEVGEMVGEYSVRSESDSAVSGSWGEDDEEFDPKRRVILLPANQLNGLLTKIKEFLQ